MSGADSTGQDDGTLPPYLRRRTASAPALPEVVVGAVEVPPAKPGQSTADERRAARRTQAASGPIVPPPVPASGAPSTSTRRWSWTPLIAGLAAVAWIGAIGLIGTGAATDGRVTSPRLTFVVAWAVASLLTFLPMQIRLGLPGLAWQGTVGWVLLGYILAFVPPPTGWLLDLPDLPVYLIFFAALFYAIAALTLPLTYVVGRQIYAHRMHQLDLRRARRQAYEFGALAVALTLLAALRVLTPLTGLLLVAVFILVETLLLSQVAPDG